MWRATKATRRRTGSVPGTLTALICLLACLFAACSTAPTRYSNRLGDDEQYSPFVKYFALDNADQRQEIVLRAFDLLGTEYRWGGSNPRDGLDCSGMVSYVVERVSRRALPHNAASIAKVTRPIKLDELAPGDLVFFNTLGKRHSHMGIYIGDKKFIHAPSSGQKIRQSRLDSRYYAERLDGLHSLTRKTEKAD